MNTITITADQAREFVENRRLELFSPCEWQPPRITRAIAGMDDDGTWFWYLSRRKELTPPHQIGDVVLLKEPCNDDYDADLSGMYDFKKVYDKDGTPAMTVTPPPAYDATPPKAKATEIELQFHEGKLRWREVWEVVE